MSIRSLKSSEISALAHSSMRPEIESNCAAIESSGDCKIFQNAGDHLIALLMDLCAIKENMSTLGSP